MDYIIQDGGAIEETKNKFIGTEVKTYSLLTFNPKSYKIFNIFLFHKRQTGPFVQQLHQDIQLKTTTILKWVMSQA